MYFICEHCKYQFESDFETEQCPDCGKLKVRKATTKEVYDYIERKINPDEYLIEDK